TTIRSEVDQTLDRELYFTTQVAFNRERTDLFTDALEFCIAEFFHFLVVRDAGSFTNLASAGASDTEDRSQTNLGVLMRRNVDAGNTSHNLSLIFPELESTLALFMARVGTNHPHHTVALDDLAIAANALYRCHYFHG